MPAKGGPYHHGDLRPALVDAAIGVIAEHGVRGFSLAEATRHLGVTTAAPYRHFADRSELLAAVAARALSDFAAMLGDAAGTADTPAQRLAAMAGAYVRFAAQQRPLFDTIFNSGLDKSRYPELQRAWEPVDALLAVVLEVFDTAAADALADAVEATAHGYAMLLIDGEYGAGPDAVQAAVAKATASAQGPHSRPPGTAARGYRRRHGMSGADDTRSEEHDMTSPRVHLEEITGQNRDRVCALRVHPGQELFVSSVAESLDEAAATPEGEPWYRAIHSDDEPAGFVMLSWNVPPGRPGMIGPYWTSPLPMRLRSASQPPASAAPTSTYATAGTRSRTSRSSRDTRAPGWSPPSAARLPT